MRRKRMQAGHVAEIAKAAVLQGLLPLLGIWFTVAFRETITIGRKRLWYPPSSSPAAGIEAEADRTSGWACRLARFALMNRQAQKSPGSMPRLIRTWLGI